MSYYELVFDRIDFYSPADESNFDYWIGDVLDATWRKYDTALHITFEGKPNDDQARELEALFKRYGVTDYEWLVPEDEE